MADSTAGQAGHEGKIRILAVDGDPETLRKIAAALQAPDREVLTVQTAAAAERALAAKKASLILLGLVLPDADGRTVFSNLRQRPDTAAIPILVISGPMGDRPRAECLALGAEDYIEKPLDVTALKSVVTSTLKRASSVGHDPFVDPLSRVPSRAALAEAFTQALTAADQSGLPFTLALTDVDGLARLNATQGRAAGDEILREVAAHLAVAVKEAGTIARWQEDEFVILFPNTEPRAAVRTLAKVQATLPAPRAAGGEGGGMAVSFSAGVAAVRPGLPLAEAVALAERALVQAKSEGWGGIVSLEDRRPDTVPTILVAEDDRVTATLVKHRLERAGFQIIHCDNGADAWATALKRRIAMFVLDIRMPGMDGVDLLKHLRANEQYAEVPILMLTSLGREEDVVRAFNLGASDYVTKPFSPVELLARVQRLLRTHHPSAR